MRVIRALRELGIASVAVYSEADRDAVHVRLADEAVAIGPPPAAESYLHAPAVLAAAADERVRGAPSGLRLPLRERGVRAGAVRTPASSSSGPRPRRSRRWARRRGARRGSRRLGVPVVPGSDGAVETLDDAFAVAERDRLPGRGEGIRRRRRDRLPRRLRPRHELEAALDAVRADGQRFFGNARCTSSATSPTRGTSRSRCSATPTATSIQLGLRDCSVQRRHQKLIEESPAPTVDDALREALGSTPSSSRARSDTRPPARSRASSSATSSTSSR